MAEALIFGGTNSLDFVDIRQGVLRIPEVSLKIEEAQKIWDKECRTSFSFQHFLCSDDHSFYNNINLKSLALAVVQMGLYARYERLFKKPKYIIGNTEGDSALNVAVGNMTFQELITSSMACSVLRPMAPLYSTTDLVLRGQSLPKYKVFEQQVGQSTAEGANLEINKYQPIFEPDINLQNLIKKTIEQKGVQRVVHIGPGTSEKTNSTNEFQYTDVQIVESIDIDPMLGWFWSNLRKQQSAAMAL